MEIKPPIAIAAIVVVVVLVGWFLWRSSGPGRFKPPPPITTGAPLQAGQLPGGQSGTGPQIQTGMPMAPGAPIAPQAEYRPGK